LAKGISGLALLGAVAGCTTLPDATIQQPATTAAKPAPRSAESLRLEQYYAKIQQRLLAQGLLRTDDGGRDAPFTARTLVEDFQKVALLDEYSLSRGKFVPSQAQSTLRRWQQPIRVGIIFDPRLPAKTRAKDNADVIRYTRRLSRLSGVPISVGTANPNFTVMFLYRDRARLIGPELKRRIPGISNVVLREISNSPRNTYCVTYAFSGGENSNTYSSAVILIKAEHQDLMRLSCIHEEMSQALGLANDSPTARPSIFNDDQEFALLTRHDELLLKMLYDRRLKPGMTAAEARPLLPAIARDALKGNS